MKYVNLKYRKIEKTINHVDILDVRIYKGLPDFPALVSSFFTPMYLFQLPWVRAPLKANIGAGGSMKILISSLFAIIFMGPAMARPHVQGLDSCKDFGRIAPTQSGQQNLAQARTCSKILVEVLKEKVAGLDRSRENCQDELLNTKASIQDAQNFQAVAKQELDSRGPSQKVKNRFKESIIDITYALTDALDERSCDPVELIEVKAQAQTEKLMLERTKYSLP